MQVTDEKIIKLDLYKDKDLYEEIILKVFYKFLNTEEILLNKDELLILLGKILKFLKNISYRNVDKIMQELKIKRDNILLNLDYLTKKDFIYNVLGLNNIKFNDNLKIRFLLNI